MVRKAIFGSEQMVDEKNAEQMAKEHKEISISEFFEKNRHLLGYDNPGIGASR